MRPQTQRSSEAFAMDLWNSQEEEAVDSREHAAVGHGSLGRDPW